MQKSIISGHQIDENKIKRKLISPQQEYKHMKNKAFISL